MPLRPNQLYLSDLIFVALLVGVLCGMVLPALMSAHYPSDPGLAYPSVAVPKLPTYVFVGAVIGTIAGVLPCLLLIGGKRTSHVERWIFASAIGAVLCLLSTGISEFVMSNFRGGSGRQQTAMGTNEAMVVGDTCKGYCWDQKAYFQNSMLKNNYFEYALTMHGKLELAKKMRPVVKTGYWPESPSLNAFWGEGSVTVPYNGYVFKILTAQGPSAPGGRRSFVDEKGRMSLGHAMVAAPAVYGLTGTDTFIVSDAGTVLQRDFGDATPEVFKAMTEYDPDKHWAPAE